MIINKITGKLHKFVEVLFVGTVFVEVLFVEKHFVRTVFIVSIV